MSCQESGAHLCQQRATKVLDFFHEPLVHTKGDWARSPFDLDDWQRDDIITPLFGRVRWDDERERYVRQYRIGFICIGRKNGKSELAAGIALYLMVADGEESAEVYGAAKDTKQAGKVWEVAERMVQLSPELRFDDDGKERLKTNRNTRRIYHEATASFYETITADAAGELGHNPHGVIFDEIVSQPHDALWNAMRTSFGTRAQAMLVALTTETNDPSSFCAGLIDEMERVQEDPARAPHIFAYVRKVPMDADPWDESNWVLANPALAGEHPFLSRQALREEALEARNDPTKENSYRQFHLNQRQQQTTRWMPLHLWDACGGLVDEAKLKGRRCFGGLDLSAKFDLTAATYLFPDDGMSVVWRFWTPETQVAFLDQHTGGQASVWARQGLLRTCDGFVIDYEQVHREIEADAQFFGLVDVSHDRWMAEPTVQEFERHKIRTFPVGQGTHGMNEPMRELMRLVKAKEINHGGNPVARWNADAIEVKRDDLDQLKPVKPDRDNSGKRIDGIVALCMSIDGWMRRGRQRTRRAAGF